MFLERTTKRGYRQGVVCGMCLVKVSSVARLNFSVTWPRLEGRRRGNLGFWSSFSVKVDGFGMKSLSVCYMCLLFLLWGSSLSQVALGLCSLPSARFLALSLSLLE